MIGIRRGVVDRRRRPGPRQPAVPGALARLPERDAQLDADFWYSLGNLPFFVLPIVAFLGSSRRGDDADADLDRRLCEAADGQLAGGRLDEPRPILAIFVLSGAAGLIDEIVWSRQLVLVFGNTTQAVSAILTGFFGGIAIGSFVGGRIADRVRSPLRMYGILELVLVVVVLVTPLSFRLIDELYRGIYPALEGSPQLLALVRVGAGGPRAGAGDGPDGRDAADADPLPRARRRS